MSTLSMTLEDVPIALMRRSTDDRILFVEIGRVMPGLCYREPHVGLTHSRPAGECVADVHAACVEQFQIHLAAALSALP